MSKNLVNLNILLLKTTKPTKKQKTLKKISEHPSIDNDKLKLWTCIILSQNYEHVTVRLFYSKVDGIRFLYKHYTENYEMEYEDFKEWIEFDGLDKANLIDVETSDMLHYYITLHEIL